MGQIKTLPYKIQHERLKQFIIDNPSVGVRFKPRNDKVYGAYRSCGLVTYHNKDGFILSFKLSEMNRVKGA